MKLVYSRNTRGSELFPAFLSLFTTTKTFVRVENANRPLFFLSSSLECLSVIEKLFERGRIEKNDLSSPNNFKVN